MALGSWRQGRDFRVLAIGCSAAFAIAAVLDLFNREPVIPITFGHAPETMGFDLRAVTVDSKPSPAGGPPKDGVPALTNPEFVGAVQADSSRPDDRVIGVTRPRQLPGW